MDHETGNAGLSPAPSSLDFEFPTLLSSDADSLSELRLQTPPRLHAPPEVGNVRMAERISDLEQQISDLRLVNADERLKYQTEIVSLRSEVQLLKYQLETQHGIVESKDHEIAAQAETISVLKQKQELLQQELLETRALKDPVENIRLAHVVAERDALLAELAAARTVLTNDGNTQLMLKVVKEREAEIAKLKQQALENVETIKLLEDELHDMKFAKREVEHDLKLLLNQRTQVQMLKSQLLAIKENKQLPQLLDNQP